MLELVTSPTTNPQSANSKIIVTGKIHLFWDLPFLTRCLDNNNIPAMIDIATKIIRNIIGLRTVIAGVFVILILSELNKHGDVYK